MTETRPEAAHIAMFSIAAHGHVRPNLEVIRELVARGHRVSYAIPPALADVVAETGARPCLYTTTLPGPDDDPSAWGTTLLDMVRPFFEDAVHALPQLAEEFAGDEPDLVLSDSTSYPSRVLARRWGVPHIQLTPHGVAWKGYEPEEVNPEFIALKQSPEGKAYYARFAEWLREQGVDMHPDDFTGHPDRSLVLIPKVMQPHADDVDEEVYTFVGSCRPEPAEQGWQRPAAAEGKRLLLVSLGSTFTDRPDLYRACADAFGDLPDWYVVLQIGRHVTRESLGPLPANTEAHAWVPQLEILRQADAFLTHAGAGGSQEGLATGTPMIAVPQAADQFMNARILADLGVARYLPAEEADAARLRETLLGLVDDPAVAEALARARRQMADEGGAVQAADIVEAALPSSRAAAERS